MWAQRQGDSDLPGCQRTAGFSVGRKWVFDLISRWESGRLLRRGHREVFGKMPPASPGGASNGACNGTGEKEEERMSELTDEIDSLRAQLAEFKLVQKAAGWCVIYDFPWREEVIFEEVFGEGRGREAYNLDIGNKQVRLLLAALCTEHILLGKEKEEREAAEVQLTEAREKMLGIVEDNKRLEADCAALRAT